MLELGEKRIAAISILLICSSYLMLYDTSNLLPDLPFLGAAVFSFHVFTKAAEDDKNPNLLLAVSLLAGFFSYMTRFPSILFLACIPVFEMLKYKSIKKSVIYAAGFLLLFLLESFIYYRLTNQIFLQITSNYSVGIKEWGINMSPISLNEFLLTPLSSYLSTNSGKLLLTCGLLGFSLALFKKNWYLVSLTVGGILLFLAYSYSITSMTPLVRALPINTRYILGFSYTMCLCTSYFLVHIPDLVPGFIKNRTTTQKKYLTLIFLIFIVTLQVIELPNLMGPKTMFFGKNDYLLVDHYIKENKDIYRDKDVNAYPTHVFKMYPNIHDMNLLPLDYSNPLQSGQTILFSKKQMEMTLDYALDRKDTVLIDQFSPFVTGCNPQLETIFDTGNLVFAKVVDNEIDLQFIANLSNYATMRDSWASHLESAKVIESDSATIGFDLQPSGEPFYIYTFPGSFGNPPEDGGEIFARFDPTQPIFIDLKYSNTEDLASLIFFVHQYDDEERLSSDRFQLESNAGRHETTMIIKVSPGATKFRILLRFDNRNTNEFIVEKLCVSNVIN